MSGPPYPPGPQPGSNAIGLFTIGVSPIGTISPFNVWATIISQYANSLVLTSLLTSYAQAMDMTENFDDFYDWMWNVNTAQGYGLDVWGRIVGVSRTVQLPSGSAPHFGFQEADDSNNTGFGQAPFYTGGTLTSNFSLLDSDFRTLIYAKAASNICDGAIPSINQILRTLFGNGYVTDGENMTMTYTFTSPLTLVQQAIIAQSNVLPKPAGVSVSVVQP